MRLLISITFDDEAKSKLYNHMKILTDNCEDGIFTKRDNIRLSLVYVGETTMIGAVVETIDAIDSRQFEITLAGKGMFRRSGKDVYWVEIEKCPELIRLQKLLHRTLVRRGVMSEKNEFKPHLTVSRDTVITPENIPAVNFTDRITVKRVSLMKCEPQRDGVAYTEVYAKDLAN